MKKDMTSPTKAAPQQDMPVNSPAARPRRAGVAPSPLKPQHQPTTTPPSVPAKAAFKTAAAAAAKAAAAAAAAAAATAGGGATAAAAPAAPALDVVMEEPPQATTAVAAVAAGAAVAAATTTASSNDTASGWWVHDKDLHAAIATRTPDELGLVWVRLKAGLHPGVTGLLTRTIPAVINWMCLWPYALQGCTHSRGVRLVDGPTWLLLLLLLLLLSSGV